MLKRLLFISLLFASTSSFAQFALNQLSFAPPPSDMSVTFLSNVFGNVDGVLSGTGSQMFGRMMSVFNSAVLALGSIVMFYTIIVGTMHTAHEGEFLGKKWSSIWIPVRASLGISLLAPKASGYCLIQIFIMWVVLQGVGAADKIWNATLDYLNTGGKLVQAKGGGGTGGERNGLDNVALTIVGAFNLSDQDDLTKSIDRAGAYKGYQSNPTYVGAIAILSGQVCMLGLQHIIENKRNDWLKNTSPTVGPCGKDSLGYDKNWEAFCKNDVPDFLNSVNVINVQQESDRSNNSKDDAQKVYEAPMPNFPTTAPDFYRSLNGTCGTIKWNNVLNLAGGLDVKNNFQLDDNQMSTMKLARAIAIQQMYSFIQNITQQMVQNDPLLNKNAKKTDKSPSDVAVTEYGFAMSSYSASSPCNELIPECQIWGGAGGNPALFAGNEFWNAVDAYDNVMSPFLSAIKQFQDIDKAKQLREFITESKNKGWILAGSYYFQLVGLSGSPFESQNEKDNKSGLDGSQGSQLPSGCPANFLPSSLCWLLSFNKLDMSPIEKLKSLIDGSQGLCSSPLANNTWDQKDGYISPKQALLSRACASTAFGFVGNSYFLWRSGQSKQSNFEMPSWEFRFPTIRIDIDRPAFPCMGLPIIGCVGRAVFGGLFSIVFDLVAVVIGALRYVGETLMNLILLYPMVKVVMPLIGSAFDLISKQMDSPILTLANMGAEFIHNITLLMMNNILFGAMAAIPEIGIAIAIILLIGSIFYAPIVALFLGFGFTTAYYVPMLPYVIFTFGAIAWIVAVIEAMVAGPIVALGITTPEGEGILGKSEQGFMILVNIFLRPSLMIIGFIAGIIMTYVSVWILSAGYGQASKILTDSNFMGLAYADNVFVQLFSKSFFVFFYISLYITVVQKAFNLISSLPDKILRWIGGSPEDHGAETQRWMQDVGEKVGQFAQKSEGGAFEVAKETQKALSDQDQSKQQGAGAPGGVRGA